MSRKRSERTRRPIPRKVNSMRVERLQQKFRALLNLDLVLFPPPSPDDCRCDKKKKFQAPKRTRRPSLGKETNDRRTTVSLPMTDGGRRRRDISGEMLRYRRWTGSTAAAEHSGLYRNQPSQAGPTPVAPDPSSPRQGKKKRTVVGKKK